MEPAEIVLDEELIGKGYQNIIFAKDQPEYIPLPAISEGNVVISKWNLTDQDIKKIFDSRSIYLMQLTFGQPLQPVRLDTDIKELA